MFAVNATTMNMVEATAPTMLEVVMIVPMPATIDIRIPEEAIIAPIAIVKRPVIPVIITIVVVCRAIGTLVISTTGNQPRYQRGQ